MDFLEIVKNRQSCRSYDGKREVETEKINAILECARLSPSACNAQPYHITVCTGESAKAAAAAVTGLGMNKFAKEAPVMLVISEESYSAAAALGAKVKKNDYRSIDIGILSAYITAAACELGLGSCIIGWLDDDKLRKICGVVGAVRLVISIGYPKPDEQLRNKKRKALSELVTEID